MSQPDVRDVHEDALLTQISLAYMNSGFIAEDLFRSLPVEHESDKYRILTKDFWFRDQAAPRAPGARAARGGYGTTTGTYSAQEYAFAHPLPQRVVDNAAPPDDPLRTGTLYATEIVKLREEIAMAAATFVTGVWTSETTLAGATKWSDYTNSNPITAIRDQARTIHSRTGKKPNTLALGKLTFDTLLDHPKITDRMKTTDDKIVNAQLLARVFDVERILVGEAIKNTAAEGAAFASGYVWTDNALLAYVDPSVGTEIPTAGYTFTKRERRVRRWFEDPEEQWVVEVSFIKDFKVVAADLGHLFIDAN